MDFTQFKNKSSVIKSKFSGEISENPPQISKFPELNPIPQNLVLKTRISQIPASMAFALSVLAFFSSSNPAMEASSSSDSLHRLGNLVVLGAVRAFEHRNEGRRLSGELVLEELGVRSLRLRKVRAE